jgi:hypothetical protein
MSMNNQDKNHLADYEKAGENLKLKAGRKNTIRVLSDLPLGDLSAFLLTYGTFKPLGGIDYTAEGSTLSFSGKTNKDGYLLHRQIPAGYYTLKVLDSEYKVPTVSSGDEPYQLWLPVEETAPAKQKGEEDRWFEIYEGEEEIEGVDEEQMTDQVDAVEEAELVNLDDEEKSHEWVSDEADGDAGAVVSGDEVAAVNEYLNLLAEEGSEEEPES